MYALLITFRSSADLDSLEGPFMEYAEVLQGVKSLISTTWILDGSTLGGFHVFASRNSAEAYLAGELMASLRAHPAFTRFRIRRYAVLDAPGRAMGTPQPFAAARFGADGAQPRCDGGR